MAVLVMGLGLVGLSPTEAHGQPAAVADADRADSLNARAVALLKAGKPKEAEPLAREAWSLKQSYDIASNLGLAELGAGKHRDAAEHLSYALRTFPSNGKPAHRKLLQTSLEQAKAELGTMVVRVSEERAVVTIDGARAGVSPLADPLFVTPGEHFLQATLEGFEPAEERVTLAKGEQKEATLTLKARAPSAGAAPATAATGATPPVAPPVGYGHPDRPPSGGASPVVLGVGYGLAGAALIAGVVTAAMSSSKAGDADDELEAVRAQGGPNACDAPAYSAPCSEIVALRGDADTLANVSLGAFVGAGALALATTIYWVAAPKRGTAALTPIVGPRDAGLSFRTQF
jgi:hypothetical protein